MAPAAPAGGGEAQRPRHVADPAGAGAVGAGAPRPRRHRARAVAARARRLGVDGELGGQTPQSVEEADVESVRDVLAPARRRVFLEVAVAPSENLREEGGEVRRRAAQIAEVKAHVRGRA